MAESTQLMSRYCDGDAHALRTLYDLLAPRLFDQLRRHTRDDVRAAALLQETFLRLHRTRDAYIRGADPEPWIHAIAAAVLRASRKSRCARSRG
jgi:DNA-directed RNA polymerase specialized sigma24 family protein